MPVFSYPLEQGPTQPPEVRTQFASSYTEEDGDYDSPSLHLTRAELAKARLLRLIAEAKVLVADLNGAYARINMPTDDDEFAIRIIEGEFASARRALVRLREVSR